MPSSSRRERRRERLAHPTSAERELAAALRRQGIRFRREASIGGGYTDLWIPRGRLAVEVDGRHHHGFGRQLARDIARSEKLCKRGISTVRFTNAEVLASPDHAARRIADVLDARRSSSSSSSRSGARASRRRSRRRRRSRS
jgi:very-short-patch-repair endonuclease